MSTRETSTTPVGTPHEAKGGGGAGRALYVLFFLSGISGLVYETVWLRILTRVVGNTIYATSVVLAAFMAGMALGSYVIGRKARGTRDQLRLYAFLELGVAVTAVVLTGVLLHVTPLYQGIYEMMQGNRGALTVVQSVLAFVLLLVPTSLMGGTLPVLSAYTKGYGKGFAPRIGILYGLNTLGAVVGVLGSGFFTIGALGETTTFLTGATLTLIVALMAFALSRREVGATGEAAMESGAGISPYGPEVRRMVGIAYLMSGFAAISYEVVWTRMFQIQVGTSIYSFSIMLAFYLVGIGLGSMLGGWFLGGVKYPLRALAMGQMGIAIYSILGLFICTLFDPVTLDLRLTQGNLLLMPPLVIFPITVVLGGMFPLVSRCYVASEGEVSRAVGRLYSMNTLGCILGSLVCGFVLIGMLGTRGTVLFLAALNVAIGVAFGMWEMPAVRRQALGIAGVSVVAVVVLGMLSPDPFRVAVSRALVQIGIPPEQEQVYYNKESATATTTAVGVGNKPESKLLLVNGIGMSNLCIETKLIAHLPLMLHPAPKDVLVICFGMGTTVRSVRVHQRIECDVVELVPEVYECFQYFHSDAAEVFADPRIHRYADDGRNFLLVHPKKYDIINIDPAPPFWSAGTVNLYTKEFFELCKSRLTDDGILCLWIPPVLSTEAALIMRTFYETFPNAHVWRGPRWPSAGFFMMGYRNKKGPVMPGFRKLEEEAAVLADLNEWDFEVKVPSLESLKALHVMNPQQLELFVAGLPVITDDTPYTEFPLWRSLFDPNFHRPISLE